MHAQGSQSYNAVSNSRPNRRRQWTWDTTQRMGMTDKQDRLARERQEIAARVAKFKATQEKFKREREEYFVTTLKNGQRSDSGFLRN